MSRQFRSPVNLLLCVGYCEMFLSKCKPIAFKIRAAHSRNMSNQNASLLVSTSLCGMSKAPAHPDTKGLSLGSTVSPPRGGDRDLSAGSLKILGLSPTVLHAGVRNHIHSQIIPSRTWGQGGCLSPSVHAAECRCKLLK